MVCLSHPYMTTGKTITLCIRIIVCKVMSLLFNKLFRFLIHCHSFSSKEQASLNFMAAMILEPKKIKSVTVSTFSPSICHEVMGLDAMILVFLNVEFWARFFALLFNLLQEVPLCFLPYGWCRLHIWGYRYSPGDLDSSLCFTQPDVSHDVLCIEVK